MHPLLLMGILFVGYLIMYRIYGKYLSKRIFKLSESAPVPSKALFDNFDYIPTRKEIIFGHHFASIAGTGPIVGPAIAIIWGWVPAVLWVFFGSIFIGAVHDFGVLIVSIRNRGYSIAEITGIYINRRTRIFFFIIGILELWIFIAILGLVMAIIFDMYPGSVLPIWLEIPIAIYLGYFIFSKDKNFFVWSFGAVAFMYLTVILGNYLPIRLNEFLGIPPTGLWTIILLIYAFIASILPVNLLMQPRDLINSHQLILAMGAMIIGIIFSTFDPDFAFVAPPFNPGPQGAPSLWPFLFIIIACGAVSGFHAIVSSGTSSKQIENEKDSLYVGYGGMLTESMLSVLVIIAVAAGIGLGFTNADGEVLTGISAWGSNYGSWEAASGMASKIDTFVQGSTNMIAAMGIPRSIAIIIMGVFVASFAGTSLDTSARMQRFFFQELFSRNGKSIFSNRYFSTAVVTGTAAVLAFASGTDGKGALSLWPLFGTINQILAALALVVVTIYLRQKGGNKWLFTALPALFMGIITLYAGITSFSGYLNQDNLLLFAINLVVLILTVWIIAEGVLLFLKSRRDEGIGSQK